MAEGKSDVLVRDDIARLNKRVTRVLDKYKRFEDMRTIMRLNRSEIVEALKNYRIDMNFIVEFFDSNKLDKLVKQTIDDVHDDLKGQGFAKPSKAFTGEAIKSIKDGFKRFFSQLLNRVAERQRDRFDRFKIEQRHVKVKRGELALIERELTLKQKKDEINKIARVKLTETWDNLKDQFGAYDTIQYRDGKHFPLDSYIDGKAKTITMETNVITTSLESKRLGVLTMKVSSHNSKDSCRLWEGQILFTSQTAKDQFIKEFPEITNAKSWKTVEQARNDKTHIFKFNCRHRLRPWPVQSFSEKKQKDQPKGPTVPKTTKELDKKTEALISKL